jgi:3-hydroxybutyryl-CoA dehydrogenase
MNKDSKIGIIGAGAMGSGIAQIAATAGHSVYLCDSNSEALSGSEAKLKKVMDRLVEKGKFDAATAGEIQDRISYVENTGSFTDCGLVIEAIVENLDIKKSVFNELESIVSKECILASNTSSLSIASIAAACTNAERVMGIHFFNPAPLMPLVEIIPAVQTDEKHLSPVIKLMKSWEKAPVLAKDTPGFIVNRIARPFYGEAIRILEEGIADYATIDWALKSKGGFRMGPFELMDFIGNDINYKVTETVFEQFFYDPRYKPSFTQKRMVEAGRLGRKTKRGYYSYEEDASNPKPNEDDELSKEIFWRILVMLINEAVDALYLHIASKEDIDLAMTKGVNYPKGLLSWADEIGLNKCLEKLDSLQAEYGEDRYRASLLMRKMVSRGDKFFE